MAFKANLVKEAKANLVFGLKTRLPLVYTLIFGSKKALLSKFKNGTENSALKKKRIHLEVFKNCFFGYYDVSPFHPQNEHWMVFLANHQNPYFKPSKKHLSTIILYNLQTDEHQILSACYVWNWQQGNRLQWLNEEEIIFNDYIPEREKLVTKILNVNTQHSQIIEEPFQSVHEQEYFLSLDYNTLFRIKSEYAYQYISAKTRMQNNILKYDFKSSSFQEVVTISAIRDFLNLPRSLKPKSEHINHILISPNGQLFIFIYRYNAGNKRHDFLLAYDFISNTLKSLVNDELISHCTWKDNENILFWGVIDHKRGYFNYHYPSHSLDLAWQSDKDGHPNFIDKESIITDTYPDNHSMQKLKKINVETQEENVLASVYHPLFFELHTRCDLHPSLSKTGKYIQVDSLSSKKREIIVFENE